MTPVLLLVDLQNDFLADAKLEPHAGFIVARATELLEGCRRREIPVVHVRTTLRRDDDRRLPHWRAQDRWRCVEGTPGHCGPEGLSPREGEWIIHKTGFNPFHGGELDRLLGERGGHIVWVAGVHLHACVRTAAVECLERGLEVRIAEDACGSNDPVHAAATRRWLSDRCVGFWRVSQLLADEVGAAARRWNHGIPGKLGQMAFQVPVADETEVAVAATKAREAWDRWRRIPRGERCASLERVLEPLQNALEELSCQMALEIGKPRSEAIEEIRRVHSNIRDVLRRAAATDDRKEGAGCVRDAPLGVVAIITAWNNPAAIPLGKIVPALAWGNGVVWKPAPAGTGIARTIMRLLELAGLPPGTVEMVTGDHSTSRWLAEQEPVSAVSVTGSTAAGHVLQEVCARRGLPFQAELNGNNAAILWDGADLRAAAAQVAWGALAFAGQRCTANRRVIVPTTQFDRVWAELELAANALVWGDPMEMATRIGPVLTEEKRNDLVRELAEVENSGRVHRLALTHGSLAKQVWVTEGAYVQPALIGCDDPDDALVREESMGPRLIVQRAQDFEHALALLNGVRQGLIASMFGGSKELRRRFLEEARAGVLKFDQGTAGVDVTLPFGGWKSSGVGPPEHGEADRQFYSRLQAIYGAVVDE